MKKTEWQRLWDRDTNWTTGYPSMSLDPDEDKAKAKVKKQSAFDKWYDSIKWDGCSKYEIAGMAWDEAAKRHNKEGCDNRFTWWFDELAPAWHACVKAKVIAKMAWDKSLTLD